MEVNNLVPKIVLHIYERKLLASLLLSENLRTKSGKVYITTKLMETEPTAQKMKFSIKDFSRSHLLKKSLMENFIFCTV